MYVHNNYVAYSNYDYHDEDWNLEGSLARPKIIIAESRLKH